MKLSEHLREIGVPAWLVRWAIIVLCASALLYAGYVLIAFALSVQFITIAVLIGFAEVSLLWPVVRWLREHGVPQVLAAIACVALFLSFFVLLLFFVVAEVVDASRDIANEITGAIEELLRWVQEDSPFASDDPDPTVQDLLSQLEDFLSGFISDLGGTVATGLGVLANLMTVVLVATFFAIFALASGDRLWSQFTNLLAGEHVRPATAAFRGAMRTTGAWFYASVLTGLVDGTLIGLGLWILDVRLAVAIGALTFLMAFIPLVGATIAGVVAVAVAFFSGGLATAIWALIIVLVVQQLEGNVLSPLLMARAVSFHPLVILILTTTSASLFGMAGLFLAVPVTGAIVAAVSGYRRNSGGGDGSSIPGAEVPPPVTDVAKT